jgi:uncharacterized protein involved in exopolysaccharide biosynthesis
MADVDKEVVADVSTGEDEISLVDYFGVIFRYRGMILAICIFSVIAAVIISLVLPKMYCATTSIVPPIDVLQKERGLTIGLGGGLGGGNTLLQKAMGITSIADMYAGILSSRVVADAIVDRYDLMNVYGETRYKSNARIKLRRRTSIKVSKNGVVSVAVEDRDPAMAAKIANAYVGELDHQNKRLSGGQATSKRLFLGNRLGQIEEELSGINDLLSREAKIKEMLYELLTREYEIAKIEEAKSMPTIQILDKAVVPEKKCKPKRVLIVAISAITGLFLAICIAFAREYSAQARVSVQSAVVGESAISN